MIKQEQPFSTLWSTMILPTRLADAPIRGSLAQTLYINRQHHKPLIAATMLAMN